MAAPGLTIQHFPKTQEGQALIETQKVFCLAGELYQGYKGTLITVYEKQLTTAELENVYDVDQSIGRVWAARKNRGSSRKYRIDEELAERRAITRAKERDELELIKLKQDLGITNLPSSIPTPEASGSEAKVEETRPIQPLPKVPDAKQSEYACTLCGKVPPKDHKSPAKWKHMHTMGAHKNPKAK